MMKTQKNPIKTGYTFLFPFFILLMMLLIKAALVIYFVSTGMIGLGPDEAQYWTWSQYLDWGYYSKPPGIAWQIWLGTQLFGNTELGVRFMSIVIGSLIPIAVYLLALRCQLKRQTAFWAAIVMMVCPIGLLSTFLATTDGGMVLFWILACCVLAGVLSEDREVAWSDYAKIGLLILCGALFKWPIYLLWVFICLAAMIYPNLRSKWMLAGILISLLGLLPSLYWNIFHDWATFQHVFATVKGGSGSSGAGRSGSLGEIGSVSLSGNGIGSGSGSGSGSVIQAIGSFLGRGNVLEFLGAQAGLLSPVFFVILVIAFWRVLFGGWKFRAQISPPLFFCGGVSLILLGVYSFAAIFQKIQGNWVVFAYPTAIVFLAWFACEKVSWGKLWLKIGSGMSVLFVVVFFLLPSPIQFALFKHNMGWSGLEKVLSEVGYDPNKNFLFSDKYQTSSLLSFYGFRESVRVDNVKEINSKDRDIEINLENKKSTKRAYFLNLQGTRKNQFSYWPGLPEEQMGKTGYFVLVENSPHLERITPEKIEEYRVHLSHFFSEVKLKGIKSLFTSVSLQNNEKILKGVIIFECQNYNGLVPPEIEKY